MPDDERRDRRSAPPARALARPVQIGSVRLRNGVMTASGTAGYGTELAGLLDLAALGAFVTKSLAAFEWAGNPAPRLHPTTARDAQRRRAAGTGPRRTGSDHVLPGPARHRCHRRGEHLGAHARRVPRGRRAAGATRPPGSWPWRSTCRAPTSTAALTSSPTTPSVGGGRRRGGGGRRPAVLGQAQPQHRPARRRRRRRCATAGAEAVTCVNTLLGLAYDQRTAARRSAPAAAGCPDRRSTRSPCAPSTTSPPPCPACRSSASAASRTAWDAAEMVLAGASAVQVGTATFADPRAAASPARCAAPGVIPGAGRDLR